MSKKKISSDVEGISSVQSDRRNFIKGAGIALGATALTSFAPSANAVTTPSSPRVANVSDPNSILNKILSTKKVKFGVDLTFAPLQFKDSKGNPTGYIIELAKSLASSLGATPEWVEIPFGSLFAAQAAGKFDMSGIAATIRPSRAQQVLFSGAPAFVESNVVLLAPNSNLKRLTQLNSSAVTIAVVVGSSQEAAAVLRYPKAKLKRLDNQAALADVAAGRSDAMIVGEFSVASAIKANSGLKPLKAGPIFVDENSFFMPAGDYDMKNYVDTWLRYETSHNTLAGLWDDYVGDDARKLGLQSISLSSSWAKGK
jgi:polar amino acid transport system substrate-binding protein